MFRRKIPCKGLGGVKVLDSPKGCTGVLFSLPSPSRTIFRRGRGLVNEGFRTGLHSVPVTIIVLRCTTGGSSVPGQSAPRVPKGLDNGDRVCRN